MENPTFSKDEDDSIEADSTQQQQQLSTEETLTKEPDKIENYQTNSTDRKLFSENLDKQRTLDPSAKKEIGIDNDAAILLDDTTESIELETDGLDRMKDDGQNNIIIANDNNDSSSKNIETSLSTDDQETDPPSSELSGQNNTEHKTESHKTSVDSIPKALKIDHVGCTDTTEDELPSKTLKPRDLSLRRTTSLQTTQSILNESTMEHQSLGKQSEHYLRYGWGRITPKFIQFLNKPIFFLVLVSIAGAAQGLVVTGVSFTILTSIEKQFGFSSSHVGLFGTVYDGGFGILCVVVGYVGHRNKPRWIGIGMIVMASGAVLLSVPKYIIGGYHAGKERDSDFCQYSTMNSYLPECGGSSPWYFTMIFLGGNLIMGIGATPLYVLGPAHIDEITKRGQNGLYNGIFATAAALGPAIGFIIGLPILNTWVDIEEVGLLILFVVFYFHFFQLKYCMKTPKHFYKIFSYNYVKYRSMLSETKKAKSFLCL